MKKLVVLLLLVSPFFSKAQLNFETKGVVNKKISRSLPEGTSVELKSLTKDPSSNRLKASLKTNGVYVLVNFDLLDNISFAYSNLREFWQVQAIKNSVYDNILKNGLQYKLRQDLEDEVHEYINYVENNNLFFEDSYLESYLYTLVYKIYPDRLKDDRPGIINIKIIEVLN